MTTREQLETNEDTRGLVQKFDFGLEVENFVKSKVGQYLINRAEAERDEALEALKVIDPEDAKGVRALQSIIARAESVQYWMADAIQEGINAEERLSEIG